MKNECPFCGKQWGKKDGLQEVLDHYKDKHPVQFNESIQIANKIVNEACAEYCKKRDAFLDVEITRTP